jgi:hypothetical protein
MPSSPRTGLFKFHTRSQNEVLGIDYSLDFDTPWRSVFVPLRTKESTDIKASNSIARTKSGTPSRIED